MGQWHAMDGDVIMHKLPKDGAVKAGWINTILKGRKQLIQESFHTFVTTSLLCCLIDPGIQAHCLIKSIQAQWGSPSAEYFSSPRPIYHKQIKLIQIQWGSPTIFHVQIQYIIKLIQVYHGDSSVF